MVMCLIEHKDFFWPLLKEHLRGNNEHVRLSKEEYERKTRDKTITDIEREDYLCPGPFCYVSYLESLSRPAFWGGEEMVIILFSMMWQVGVTILKAETLHNIKFRHQQRISNSDSLLVHCSGQHYVVVSKPSLFLIEPVQCIYFGALISVNGAPVGPSGAPVRLLALGFSTLYCNMQNYPFPVLAPWWHASQWSGMPVSLNGTLVGACHFNFGTPVFVVKKTTDTDDEGYVVMNTSTLAVGPLIKSPGYDIKQEDPSIQMIS